MLPTYKGNLPFECWCVDLLKWGKFLIIVCVCMFSKWVEAGVLADGRSGTVARWVHSEVVCRFGTPPNHSVGPWDRISRGVCLLPQGHGVRHSLILLQYPQANGLVERYNGVILAGLQCIAAAVPGAPLQDILPEVLAGLRFLPCLVGY